MSRNAWRPRTSLKGARSARQGAKLPARIPGLKVSIAAIDTFKPGMRAGHFAPWRADLAPFNDVRGRQAFRLMVDRPSMVKQAYSGYAEIANDMPNPADPAYPTL